jgi:hypothetical protein
LLSSCIPYNGLVLYPKTQIQNEPP